MAIEIPDQITGYIDQIKECCDCFKCAEDEEWYRAVSVAFETWGQLTCGNYLDLHELRSVFPLSLECGSCCPVTYVANLPEEFVNDDTISVTLRTWNGIKPTLKDLEYYYDPITHDLHVDLTNEQDCCNNCAKYDMVIEYTVGTETIPSELCAWFCNIAKVYLLFAEIECSECGSMDNVAIVEVDGTKDLSATIKNMTMKYFSLVIENYSLCYLKGIRDWSVISK